MVYVGFVLAIILVTMAIAKKGLNPRVITNPITQAYEHVYLFVRQMCVGIIGSHGEKFVPFILTFWLMIFVSNVVALFFPTSPTADLSFNLGMALVSIGYVQYAGVASQVEHLRHEGRAGPGAVATAILRHIGHFAGPKLGIAFIAINGLIFLIEIISELMKNVSLSLRLFGNIEAGHLAVDAMNQLGDSIYVPVGALLLMPIKLLTCIVQALIFCLLTCVYISLVTHHEEEGHKDHAPVPATAH
jgi:F-type H+-transporting ATPase subunit a